jgi:putative acetyltransferase
VIIRPEQPQDIQSIEELTIAAFAGKPYADGTEHLIINRLRTAGALTLSLVAEIEGRVVGHVAFSEVKISGSAVGWFGLGPISVHPAFQRQGVGSALIREGLANIRAVGGQGCVLEGSPEYYQRFGFYSYPNLIYEKAPAPQYFMAHPFTGDVPAGRVEFHPAFYTSP